MTSRLRNRTGLPAAYRRVVLFTPMDWQLEIVGLVGLLMVGTRARPLEALREAFDANSRVTPPTGRGRKHDRS